MNTTPRRSSIRCTQAPPITLVMLIGTGLYFGFTATWMLEFGHITAWRGPIAVLLIASLGAATGLAFALASGRRPYCSLPDVRNVPPVKAGDHIPS